MSHAPDDWQFISCDVGQGDMSLIRIDEHTAIAIDAGPDDAAARSCLQWAGQPEIEAVYLSHGHADHLGGLSGLCSQCTIFSSDHSLATVSKKYPQYHSATVTAGEIFTVPHKLDLEIVQAPRASEHIAGSNKSAQENNSSMVVLASLRSPRQDSSVNILFTGDLEVAATPQLTAQLTRRTVNILKVPHHGSRYSGTQLEVSLRPSVGIISSGAHNSYGHPHQEILDALRAQGIQQLRTDEAGHMAFSWNPSSSNLDLTRQKS